ncbi:MAG: alkaline phosphatase [Thermoguttaceae bacterium]|nr:alkaline phosphatase [Thermoguttaceae bacterium]
MRVLLQNFTRLVLGLILVLTLTVSASAKTNYILMIVDGGGEGAYRIGSQFYTGEDRGLPYMKHADGWKEFGCTTYSKSGIVQDTKTTDAGTEKIVNYSEDGSYSPDTHWLTFEKHMENPTDSAASATALNAGVKTKNGRINFDENGKQLETVADFAVARGFAAGSITNVMPSHATPAAVAGHNMSRGEGKDLWREMVKKDVLSVVIGAAHPWYDKNGERREEPQFNPYGPSEHAWGLITTEPNYYGWTFIEKREDFQKIASGEVPAPKKLMGLPQVAGTFQSSRSHDRARNENVPTLTECCLAGLNTLNQNEKGFYLMVESGSVDWLTGNAPRTIEEMCEFFDAVQAICDWVEKNSSWEETTIILTADHETGALFGPLADKPETMFQAPIGKGKGQIPECNFFKKSHTNAPVPFFVKGPGAEKFEQRVKCTDETFGKMWGFDGKIIDNTDTAQVGKELFEGK